MKYNAVFCQNLTDMEESMIKIKRFAALFMAGIMAAGVMTGCGNKKYDVAYDYNAADYITVGNYKGVEAELGDYTVTDEQLQNVIDQVIEKYVDYSEVDRAAQDKDQVVLDFTAYISGQKVDGFSGQDYSVVIGSGNFLVDGFEEQLVGLSAGDKRAITGLRIPENFAQEASYAGRAVTFDINIKSVNEPVYPEYNDEFVNAASEGKYTTVDEYNKMLMGQLEDNAATNKYNDKYDIVMDKIVAATTLNKELPEEYVTKKEEEITKTSDFYSGLYDYTTDEYIQKTYGAENAREAAENIVMLEFIIQQIITEQNFTVTEKYYKDHIADTAAKRNYSTTERLEKDYTKDGVVKLMLMDMAEDYIMNNAVEVAK